MKLIGLSCTMLALVLASCQKPMADPLADAPPVVPTPVVPTPVPTPDYAPPGTFYLLAPVRKETKDGIIRLVPGTEVKLSRKGKYLTPEGEMALDPRILTNDRTAARAARNADLAGQGAARPKGQAAVASLTAPIPMTLAAQTGNRPGAATPAPDADKVRAMKFKLSALKNEEAKLQENVDYLMERASHPGIKMGRPATGLSSSTALSDWDNINAKLIKVREEIAILESQIQAAGS